MNVERLLGDLLMGGMGGKGKKRRSGASAMLGGLGISKAQVGVGLLGVAFAAWDHYKQGQSQGPGQGQGQGSALPPQPVAGSMPPPPAAAMPPPPPPPPPAGAAHQGDLMLMLEVMIAAAHADGRIDAQERATILQKAMELELSSAERQRLMQALDAPPSVAELAARARPQIAADLYGAAVLAISVDTPEERAWLDAWGQALALTPADRTALEQRLGVLLPAG